jgi:hypothetical protein
MVGWGVGGRGGLFGGREGTEQEVGCRDMVEDWAGAARVAVGAARRQAGGVGPGPRGRGAGGRAAPPRANAPISPSLQPLANSLSFAPHTHTARTHAANNNTCAHTCTLTRAHAHMRTCTSPPPPPEPLLIELPQPLIDELGLGPRHLLLNTARLHLNSHIATAHSRGPEKGW